MGLKVGGCEQRQSADGSGPGYAACGDGWLERAVRNPGVRSLVEAIPTGRAVSLERELFPTWIAGGLYGFATASAFIDIGTPEELVRRHAPEQTVVVATQDPSAEDRFRPIPEVDSVSTRDGRVAIRGRGEHLVARVIACVAEHRMDVTDFRTERSNLEDVFLKVTGHSIRN